MERGFSSGVCLGEGGPGREGGAGLGTNPGRAGPVVTMATLVCQEEEGTEVGSPEPWRNRQL